MKFFFEASVGQLCFSLNTLPCTLGYPPSSDEHVLAYAESLISNTFLNFIPTMPSGVLCPSWALAMVEVKVGCCPFGSDLSRLDSKGMEENLGSGLVPGGWGLRVGYATLGVWIRFQIEAGLGGWPLKGAGGGFLSWQVMGLFDPNRGWLGWRPCSSLG